MYPGEAAWYFVKLPKALSAELNFAYAESKRGFGSLPVTATLGNTTWQTSIFYDTKTEQFWLPLKAEVRKKERIIDGAKVSVAVTIRT